VALLPVLLGWPMVLTPMLIALLELIIDPACSVVLEAEPEEASVMRRPPRAPTSSLLSRALLAWSLVQGVVAFTVVAAVFAMAVRSSLSVETVRTLVFLTLVGVNFTLIFVNRTFSASLRAAFGRPNKMLWWGLGIASVVLAVVAGLPEARRFFGLGVLLPSQWLVCAMAAVTLLVGLELAKRAWQRPLEH
jgi:Ca2+-transporting ATPase